MCSAYAAHMCTTATKRNALWQKNVHYGGKVCTTDSAYECTVVHRSALEKCIFLACMHYGYY